MNSVLSRAPGRRGVRRPGWTLMTALLILAIAASSALVFTSRVELLKLAVIVALWAAVAAAFVSVIYRRQSDVDQARARDLKLVYDLQLDREISARREYELTVESQLRRELASELRAQAADEVAALRSELSALRTNLEILFDADLSHRPALEQERTTVRAYSDWARTGTESAPRVAPAAPAYYPEDPVTQTAENPIIDVPEVRIPTGAIPVPQMPPPRPDPGPGMHGESHRGSHRRAAEEAHKPPPAAGRWAQPPQPFIAPEPRREPEAPPTPPAAPPQPWVAPAATPAPTPTPAPTSTPAWQPVGAEGEWLPPGSPGSSWSVDTSGESGRHGDTESRHAGNQVAGAHAAEAPERSAEVPSRHARHAEPAASGGRRRRREESRHSTDAAGNHARPTPVDSPAPTSAPPPESAPASVPTVPARHSTGVEAGAESAPTTGGQSVAELLARLQTVPAEGRRRRRREE